MRQMRRYGRELIYAPQISPDEVTFIPKVRQHVEQPIQTGIALSTVMAVHGVLGVPDHGIQKCELAVRQHMTLSGRLIELGNKTAFEIQRSFIFVWNW